MQKIDNIEIKNFKSIRHQKIEGCKKINVFIGNPNVGKSNILEAISLASNFSNNGKSVSLKDTCRFEDLIGLFNDGDKKRAITITIDGFVYLLQYISRDLINYYVIPTESFSSTSSPDDFASKKVSIKENGTFFDYKINDLIKSPVIKIKKFQFNTNSKKLENNPTELDYPFGDNLFEVLRFNKDLRKECGELFDKYGLKLYFEKDYELKITKHLDEFTFFPIPFSQVADTLQRLIFYKAAIATNQNSILLFEEPEAHMFPPFISKFTSDIVYNENNNQYFILTHSPFVLNNLLDNLEQSDLAISIVSYKKETGETLVYRMTEEEMHEAYQLGYDFFLNISEFITEKANG